MVLIQHVAYRQDAIITQIRHYRNYYVSCII